MVAHMSRISCKLYRKSLTLAITGIATLGLLTACAGSDVDVAQPDGEPQA